MNNLVREPVIRELICQKGGGCSTPGCPLKSAEFDTEIFDHRMIRMFGLRKIVHTAGVVELLRQARLGIT